MTKLKGISEYNERTAGNIATATTGYKHLDSGDGKFAPADGIVSVVPWNGVSVTFSATAFAGIGEDIPSGKCYSVIPLRCKDITVTAGECLVGLKVPSQIT